MLQVQREGGEPHSQQISAQFIKCSLIPTPQPAWGSGGGAFSAAASNGSLTGLVQAGPLTDGELLACDPATGLWRAVQVKNCLACQQRGKTCCSLCKGSCLCLEAMRFPLFEKCPDSLAMLHAKDPKG